MEAYLVVLILLTGLIIGAAGGYYLKGRLQDAEIAALTEQIVILKSGSDDMLNNVKAAFQDLASEVAKSNSEDFLTLAATKLEGIVQVGAGDLRSTKEQIDRSLRATNQAAESLSGQVSAIREGLETQSLSTDSLRTTAEGLRNVLSSSQQRGRWGERIIEDIIQKIGLVKEMSYQTQRVFDDGSKPDFTFILSDGMIVNLDVKFPFDNYEACLNAGSEHEAEDKKKAFVQDVKRHLKTLAGTGYINPSEGTLDYMLAFIPNESMFAFIHEADPTLADYGMEKGIVMVSPLMLYSVLSMIRQSVRAFSMSQEMGVALTKIDKFVGEWRKQNELIEKMGRSIGTLNKDFEMLTTTRHNALERIIKSIEDIRDQGTGDVEMLAAPALDMSGGDHE